ncbi:MULTISPECIES: threonine-phosphate decarboxylase [unclassified Sphingopyxis]|jgi:cobalamin biosynthetic protein CobC|uniref:threonine-phosphate decarboxylase n=1 Tax=unclassified Sphingopyxis TaxID=2614943 RepID=UPI0006C273C9|nr:MULTISPECIES: threonine-phosphate decarboxylase [unclassified Sphingopyxis]USI76482.1 pyridoxal phosphate-dependent class II aminotransferase [Sphingopyxis sp. USTB-05]GAO76782.1 L-threonine 3-O-phosphate decarboxylase [Sphingopyxis sp. C-1]
MTGAWTWHGGGLETAKRHFGDGDWIDLSTGINPRPWPGAAEMTFDWQRLPDPPALARLEAVAASYFGVAAQHICAVPGTEIGLRLVGSLIGGPAQHVAPGYRTHGDMIAGSMAIDGTAAQNSAGNLILANPNNPDGRTIDADRVRALLDGRNGWLLVDEAFADVDPLVNVARSVDDAEKLIVFRSFGKFFGLAGVRLGFVVAPQAIVAALRDRLGAWPLSAAAIAIGTAAYADADWIAAARQRLPEEAAALDAMLAQHGFQPVGACPLFRLIEAENAHALFQRLARCAILTRPFSDRPRWLRIGLPADASALTRLEAALADG